MTENKKTRRAMETPIMRTFVRAPISSISRWQELKEESGTGLCRISVIGEAPGPASNPPHVTLYVLDGANLGGDNPLRPDEARRCAENLRPGDWIEAVGVVGPERATAERQEVIVTEPVRLKERGPAWAEAEEEGSEEEKEGEGEEIVCRVGKSSACYGGKSSAPLYGEEGMAGDSTFDGESVICEACYIAIGCPVATPGGHPATLAEGKGQPAEVPA